jgi:hypothetical protein
LLISAGAIEGHFEGKTPQEGHQEGLVLARQYPGSPALATQKKLAYLGFLCLNRPPYFPDLAPSDYTCSLDCKNDRLEGRHFSYDKVIAASETWLDGQISDFF